MALSKSSKRKILINVIITLVVAFFSFYYLFKSEIITLEKISKINVLSYFIILVVFFIALLLLAFIDWLVYRSFTKSMPYYKCIFNTINGNLGSNATPFKSGHFPLMVYYQANSGVPVPDTLIGLTKCQVIYSITSIFVYLVLSLFLLINGNTVNISGTTVGLWIFVGVGFLFHFAVFIVLMILSFSDKLRFKILSIWATLLKKLKRLSDVDKYVQEKTDKCLLYREQFEVIWKSFHKYLFPCFLYIILMLLQGSMQYFSYLLISGASFSFNDLFVFYVLNLTATYINNVMPIPGGVGTAEIIFGLVYTLIIPDSIIGTVLILWRSATYYFVIIIELIVFILSIFLKKYNKQSAVVDSVIENNMFNEINLSNSSSGEEENKAKDDACKKELED